MKEYFIHSIQLLQKHALIENNYNVISDELFIHTDHLTISNISKGFVIYEKLSV